MGTGDSDKMMDATRHERERIEALKKTGLMLAAQAPGRKGSAEALLEVARELIRGYNMGSARWDETRKAGARATAELAGCSSAVLELVMDDARNYGKQQHCEDAFPFSPNSFDVLGMVGCDEDLVMSFLEEILKSEYGTPRWAALDVLCEARHPKADGLLRKVVSGDFPPVKLDLETDIDLISSKRGMDFLDEGGEG